MKHSGTIKQPWIFSCYKNIVSSWLSYHNESILVLRGMPFLASKTCSGIVMVHTCLCCYRCLTLQGSRIKCHELPESQRMWWCSYGHVLQPVRHSVREDNKWEVTQGNSSLFSSHAISGKLRFIIVWLTHLMATWWLQRRPVINVIFLISTLLFHSMWPNSHGEFACPTLSEIAGSAYSTEHTLGPGVVMWHCRQSWCWWSWSVIAD